MVVVYSLSLSKTKQSSCSRVCPIVLLIIIIIFISYGPTSCIIKIPWSEALDHS